MASHVVGVAIRTNKLNILLYQETETFACGVRVVRVCGRPPPVKHGIAGSLGMMITAVWNTATRLPRLLSVTFAAIIDRSSQLNFAFARTKREQSINDQIRLLSIEYMSFGVREPSVSWR